jgi:hypothetical protein
MPPVSSIVSLAQISGQWMLLDRRPQMPSLIGVPDDVDRRDPSVTDIERGCLHETAVDTDVARQAINDGGMQQRGRTHGSSLDLLI